jgi:hypothetical protein
MLQDQRNGFAKVREAFLPRFALAVSARNFGAIGDMPRAVLFDDSGEFIVHVVILAP